MGAAQKFLVHFTVFGIIAATATFIGRKVFGDNYIESDLYLLQIVYLGVILALMTAYVLENGYRSFLPVVLLCICSPIIHYCATYIAINIPATLLGISDENGLYAGFVGGFVGGIAFLSIVEKLFFRTVTIKRNLFYATLLAMVAMLAFGLFYGKEGSEQLPPIFFMTLHGLWQGLAIALVGTFQNRSV